MNNEQRRILVEAIAERYLDNVDLRDLERFFFDTQVEYLGDYSNEELESAAEDYFSPEEIEELMGKTIAA